MSRRQSPWTRVDASQTEDTLQPLRPSSSAGRHNPAATNQAELRTRLHEARQELADVSEKLDESSSQLHAVLDSQSWRVGHAIVRPLGRLARRLKGQPPPPPVVHASTPGLPAVRLSASSKRYLELLKGVLTDSLQGDPFRPYSPDRDSEAYELWQRLQGAVPHNNVELVRRVGYDPVKRTEGRDWPSRADTMVGLKRLDQLQDSIETVGRDAVPGDVVEAGVWRGGASIFMRAVLRELGDDTRTVWACDSFQGLPKPNPDRYPQDAGDAHWKRPELAVSVETVKQNFERYGLFDDQVRLVEGWFEDTLPSLPPEQIAVLRLDGDMYGSTMIALQSLEPRVPPGGFIIIDDYGAIESCRQAVHHYCDARGIEPDITWIDWTGAYWRKS